MAVPAMLRFDQQPGWDDEDIWVLGKAGPQSKGSRVLLPVPPDVYILDVLP